MKQQAFWLNKWNKSEIGFDQKVPNRWLEHYRTQIGDVRGKRVFVPLCGKSIDMVWFAKQGAEVVGVELSPLAIEQFLAERDAAGVQLLQADIFELTPEQLGPIDLVYDRAALIALPVDVRKEYAQKMKGLVGPGAEMWINTLSYTSDKPLKPPYSVDDKEVRELFEDTYEVEVLHHDPEVELAAHLLSRGLENPTEWIFQLRRN